MSKSKRPPDHAARFRLSPRGLAAEHALRKATGLLEGFARRAATRIARMAWSGSHGLEPDDGAYLTEISVRTLTMRQIGEAMAIWSQTRDMVSTTVSRLVERGLLVSSGDLAEDPIPISLHTAERELSEAQDALESITGGRRASDTVHVGHVDPSVRHAFFRVVTAHRLVTTLSDHPPAAPTDAPEAPTDAPEAADEALAAPPEAPPDASRSPSPTGAGSSSPRP